MFIIPELFKFMFKYIQNKNFVINASGAVSFALTVLTVTDFCFSSFLNSLLLVFVLVPKHFSPCMSEGSWSLQFLCSHVTFFCHQWGLGPSQPQHGPRITENRRYFHTMLSDCHRFSRHMHSLVLLCLLLWFDIEGLCSVSPWVRMWNRQHADIQGRSCVYCRY